MKIRNQQTDVLRGLAILLMLGRDNPYYELWHRVGWIGVDLFSVLSGFLISGLLFSDTKQPERSTFHVSSSGARLKIYPAYYFFLLTLLPFTIRSLPTSDWLLMQSFWPTFWGHGWSLAIEEHFYIALPLVLLASYKIVARLRFCWRSVRLSGHPSLMACHANARRGERIQ